MIPDPVPGTCWHISGFDWFKACTYLVYSVEPEISSYGGPRVRVSYVTECDERGLILYEQGQLLEIERNIDWVLDPDGILHVSKKMKKR